MLKLNYNLSSPQWTNGIAFSLGILLIFLGHLFLPTFLSEGSTRLFTIFVLGLSTAFALLSIFISPNLTWSRILTNVLFFILGQIAAGVAKISISYVKVGNSDIDAYFYILKSSAASLILGALYSASVWCLVLPLYKVLKKYWPRN